ncbi:MAG: hypothetical protein ACJ8FS_16345 [Sphingomicrobium sp.]
MASRYPLLVEQPAQPDLTDIAIRRETSRQAYANTLGDRDPVDARKANVVGQTLGIPGPTIEADLQGFKNQAQAQQSIDLLGNDHHLASFVADEHNAAAVKDDLPALSQMSALFKFGDNEARAGFNNYMRRSTGHHALLTALGMTPSAKTYNIEDLGKTSAPRFSDTPMPEPMHRYVSPSEWFEGLAASLNANLEQSGRGMESFLADRLDVNAWKGNPVSTFLRRDVADSALAQQDYFTASQQVADTLPTWLSQQAYYASQSMAAMGAAILTKKPITSMSFQQGSQEYQQVRERGGSANEALAAGTVSGTAEGVFERYFGLGWMLGNFGKKASGKFIGGLLMREVPSEVATTAVQDLADALTTGGTGWEEYKRQHTELSKDNPLIQTAVQTAMLTGVVGGGHFIAHNLSRQAKSVQDIEAAGAGQQFLSALMNTAEQSKVRKEDPETLRSFIDQRTQDSPIRNVYLPVEAAVKYMQSEGYGGELDQYKEQIAQAQATQGDVVIPVANAVSDLAGTPAWEALKDDVRIAPGGLSAREAQSQQGEIMAQLEQRGKEIAQQVQEEGPAKTSAGKVYTEVKNRLRVAGIDEKQSEAVSQLYAARYEARAARRGGTPMEQFKASKISFPGEQGKVKGGRRVAQTSADVERVAQEIADYADSVGVDAAAQQRIGRFAPELELTDLFAREPGKGAGTKVMKELIKKADKAGLNVAVYPTSERNVKFYNRFGFVREDGGRGMLVRQQPLSEEDIRTLGQGPRGETAFTDSGAKIISLFATADRSTLLHETGHIWLEELKADATAPDAVDADKADWAAVTKWFNANGHKIGKSGFIPEAAHEMWARGVERYVMEGKAPTLGLQSTFRTFKAWLLKIYGVVQNLNSPLTPEVRDVMDRLLATQDAIDEARQVNATEPLFKTAKDAGMTDAEFADYQQRVADARDEAYDALLFKTMEKIRREKTAEMRDVRASIKADAAQQVAAQPQFKLLHLLRTGKWLGEPDRAAENVKLNTGWLIDNFGEDILDKLPRGIQIWAGAGENGDVIAEMVGMASGSEVVHTLVGMRAASDALRASGETRSLRDKMVDDIVDKAMTDRFGDVLHDGTIEEEAVAALNTARQGEIIASEARQLAKRNIVLGTPTPYQFAREWARRTVAASHVRDVASRSALQRYIRATNKSARAAEKAILAGDVDEAYRQKQAQLLNHALLAEAKAAADNIDKIVARLKKLGSRAAMKSISPSYLEKIHMLLENYDFRSRSQRSIDEQEGFQKWLEDQRSKGFEVHIPPRLENNGTPYTRVTVEELSSLNDIVESLVKLGRAKQKMIVAGKERDWAEHRDLMVARLRAMGDRKMTETVWRKGIPYKTTAPPINEQGAFIAKVASDFVKIEKLAEYIDGSTEGPFNDLLVSGSRTAENLRHQLRQDVLDPLAKTYKSLGRKYWNRLQERVTIPELTWNTLNEGDPRLGSPVTITRSELLAIYMNMGNLSNLEKLSKGERWPVATLKAVMNRELVKEDYDLAQKLWDQVGQLWPHIVRVEGEMAGVVPEKVVEAPLQTPHGEYAGGYWPVVYDPARWQKAEDMEGKQLDDMFGLKSGVATQKGHTITRTAAFGPLNLSIERVLFNHIEQVVTRIAYAPFARDVLRTMRDPTIRGWMDTKLDPAFRKQIEPWLLQQINAGAINAKAARWWEKTLRQFRINTQIAAMGFSHTVLLAQSEGLFASADRIGAPWVAAGLKRYALHPIDTVRFVLGSSDEMRNRNEAFSREAAEMSQRMRGKHSWFTTMQNAALKPIGWADRYTVSVPTWMGAYMKSRDSGANHDEAVLFADKSVRMSQGAGTPKDLAAVQARTGEGSRFFTMFYSPFNVMFNQQWAGVRALKDPRQSFMGMKGSPVPLLRTTFYWVVLTSMADAMLHHDWPDWGDPEEIEKWFTRNVFFGLWAGIPIARDLATWANQSLGGQYAGDPGSTPVSRTLSAITKATKDAVKWEKTGEGPKHPIKEAAGTTAIVAGVPIRQAGGAAQFLWDVHHDEQDPQSVSDWYFGLTTGRVPKKTEEEKR